MRGATWDRDVTVFDRRADGYESGRIGALHQRIIEHVATLIPRREENPRRVLDVGCGTGTMLRLLAEQMPWAECLLGVDPASGMARAAQRGTADPRIRWTIGVAERLPFATATFDLVVSTTSFDHWANQRRGLAECARVLCPGRPLVLCDLFSPLLLPTTWVGRRGKARTKRSASALLTEAGFRSLTWHPSMLIGTVIAI